MKTKNLILIFTVAIGMAFSSCRQKDPINSNSGEGTLRVQINNVVDGIALKLKDGAYVNEAGDSFSVDIYKYYISNIILHNVNGDKYVQPESYYLVDEEVDDSKKINIINVPNGEYNAITFLIGVDSTRNVSGAQTGALAARNQMFWTWSTGYIMAKMEGRSNVSSNPRGEFRHHISGFYEPYNTIRSVTLTFPSKAIVSDSKIPNVHIKAELLEWFKTPNLISIADYTDVNSVGDKANNVADNYSDMFRVDHID